MIQCLPALGQSLLANAEKLLELCPDPGEAQGLRQSEGTEPGTGQTWVPNKSSVRAWEGRPEQPD